MNSTTLECQRDTSSAIRLRGVQAGVPARPEAVHSAPRERDHRMAPKRI